MLLGVSRLVPRKGFDVLLKTMSGVFRERAWRLTLLGVVLAPLFLLPSRRVGRPDVPRARARSAG